MTPEVSLIIPSRLCRFAAKTVDDAIETYGVIYLITNNITGKQYVGQTTKNISERWRLHLRDVKRYNTLLANAIRKYGNNNFSINELCKAFSAEELNLLEIKCVSDYNTMKPFGYNLTSGGNQAPCPEETKLAISLANKGNKYCLGRVLSKETKNKLSQAMKGKVSPRRGVRLSEKTKLKISQANKGRLLGIKKGPMSQFSKHLLSIARKGKPGTPHTEEFKNKLSLRSKGNKYSLGIKMSEKFIEKKKIFAQKRQRNSLGQFMPMKEA